MNYILLAIAAFMLFGSKKKFNVTNVTVDFTMSGPNCQVVFSDSTGNITAVYKSNGLVQTIAVPNNQLTITFTQLEADPGAVTYLKIDDDNLIGTGNSVVVDSLSSTYYVITNMR